MAANESTKLQVNFKLADGTLINLYADSAAELEGQLQSISDMAQLILATGSNFTNKGNIAYAVKSLGATVIDEPVWATSDPAPQTHPQWHQPNAQMPSGSEYVCKHGPMKLKQGVSEKTGKPWSGYFCTAPKDQACDVKWNR